MLTFTVNRETMTHLKHEIVSALRCAWLALKAAESEDVGPVKCYPLASWHIGDEDRGQDWATRADLAEILRQLSDDLETP